MKVNSIQEAWKKVNEIFPSDYTQDMESSVRAGYPIYRSNVEHYDYICNLGSRMEINLKEGNQSINIWIEEEEQGNDVEVTVIAKSGETRTYKTYAEYRQEFRFFLSSGKRYEDNEKHFEKIIKALREIDEDDAKAESHRSGLTTVFTFKKWRSCIDC